MHAAGHTGTWALYLISQHPEVEARIAAELDAAELLVTSARLQPRPADFEDISRLPYLKCVIKVCFAPACMLAKIGLGCHPGGAKVNWYVAWTSQETLRMFPPVGVGQVRHTPLPFTCWHTLKYDWP